jgi:hypothetical protein
MYPLFAASLALTGVGTVTVPATVKPLPMATPPDTKRAPVIVEVDAVVFVMDTTPEETSDVKVPKEVIVGCDGKSR